MLRKIWIILLLLPVVLGCASCQWHEAKEVIAMADSIDQTQHVIYDDTAALGGVIRTLDNPLGKLLMSNTLGKAYYYMGRNLEDQYQQIPEAAACYIEADRLHINDPIYRGRVNSCMGYICGQNNSDSLDLIFCLRAYEAFNKTDITGYQVHMLLNIAEAYISLHDFVKADSVLKIAESYDIEDNNYRNRLLRYRGMYYYQQHMYDTAHVYYLTALHHSAYRENICRDYLNLARTYLKLDSLSQATLYAQYTIECSSNPANISNAYYVLLQQANENQDTELLSQYSHAREDAGREYANICVKYAEAVTLLKEYVSNPYPWRWVWILFISTLCVCLLCLISALIFRKHAQTARNAVEDIATHMHLQEEQLLENQFLLDCNTILSSIIDKYHTPHKRWRKYRMLKNDVDPWLHDWIGKLDALPLSEQEKIFCTISLIYSHWTDVDIADYMCYTKDSIRIIKNRILKKLGISSSEFTKFLRDLFLET